MTKDQLDYHLEALLGVDNINQWWESPNIYFNYHTPITIYEQSEEGKKKVEDYIMGYCFGK